MRIGHLIHLFTQVKPNCKTYYTNLNKVQLQLMNQNINKIIKKDNNVYYKSFLLDSSFYKEDFINSDHLNEMGAKKLTEKLEILIKNLNNLE